ncbi:MAG TPA: 1-(5-phosphoribosyl)-5-[(5-phosphoribosylamino)methylideneamino]imidazole-4-carboxamide isomerase [Fimbriimonadaceae bacterium]|nr:1-(5-phosphoribosyl)-5-[(5-phosphoribosylamino)methylideneamino]imidazole-4-carboxamide isomerase [Fimbriimonadaceae bacterium]
MELIPAIDLLGGQCVRLYQGDYARATVYGSSPEAVAREFIEAGAERVHVVDLDGARTGRPANGTIVARLAQLFPDRIQVGGGVRSLETAESLLAGGVARVIVGTGLLGTEAEAARWFGVLRDRVVAGIDARDGFVSAHGWTETGTVEAIGFARRMVDLGCCRIIYTDIATDGTLSGPNVEAMREMVVASGVPVVASGGVGSLDDLARLRDTGVEAVIVGRALYEGRVNVASAVEFLR